MACTDMVIVFSGFRDDALKEQIQAAGGKVATSLVKSATHLLLKKEGKASKKIDEAKEKGVELVFLDDFLEEYEFSLGVKEKAEPKAEPKATEADMTLMAKVMLAFATNTGNAAAMAALEELQRRLAAL
jgi:hypothetical protein